MMRLAAGAAHRKRFGELELLDLNSPAVGDEGTVHVAQLTSLKDLGLDVTRVPNADLRHLSRQEKMEKRMRLLSGI